MQGGSVSDSPDLDRHPELQKALDRRNFIKSAAAGTTLIALGSASPSTT
jgi:hypothetical protein